MLQEAPVQKGSQAGAIYIEFVISILAIVSLMIITVDVLRLSYENANAQFIVNRAIRDAALNVNPAVQFDKSVLDREWQVALSPSQRFASVTKLITQTAARYGVPENGLRIKICRMNGACDIDAGYGGDVISIEISYDFHMMFYTFVSEIKASAVARNEPFRLAS